jgi:hypothetical protein
MEKNHQKLSMTGAGMDHIWVKRNWTLESSIARLWGWKPRISNKSTHLTMQAEQSKMTGRCGLSLTNQEGFKDG